MARITVEDCIDKFPSRFELVLVASNRARKLHSGEEATVEIDNDKHTVIALREIAEETVTAEHLKNDLIEEYQTTVFSEDEDINELEIEDNSDENEPKVDEEMKEKEIDTDYQTKDAASDQASHDNLESLSNEDKSKEL
tara:strand:+ start:73 stop:489 length:417 start_codon:yes stop_codon:yes gene_type:complete